MSSLHVKLSSNEQAALLEKEIAERRKRRLVQVREQEKEFAKKVRENVRRKKEEERQILNTHIKEHLIREHKNQLRQLEETLIARRQQVGQAHRDAQTIEQEEQRLQELRLLLSSQQRLMAKKREALAMQELADNQLRDKAKKENIILTRNNALTVEKERAKSVTSSKKWFNSPSLLIMDLETKSSRGLSTRRVQGVEAFASTYFHLPNDLVHRETTPNPYELDAIQAAEQELLEEQEQLRKQNVLKDEQQVKAYLRHKHALAQVKLEKEKVTLMKDLSFMAREDRTHRQQVLQHLPANLYQPIQQRLQQKELQQYEMEHAFEKLITRHQPTCDEDTTEGLPTWSGASAPININSISQGEDSIREYISESITTPNDTKDDSNKVEEEKSSESSSSISTIGVLTNKDTTSGSSSQATTGVSRLVGMIRAQQEAWNERIASLQSKDSTNAHEQEEKHEVNNSLSISAISNSQCDPSSDDASVLHTNTIGSVPTTTICDTTTAIPVISANTTSVANTTTSAVNTTTSAVNTTTSAVNTTTGLPSTDLTIETIEDTIHEPSETTPFLPPPTSSGPTLQQYYHQPVYYYNNQWYYSYHHYNHPTGIIPSYYPTIPPPTAAVHREQLPPTETNISNEIVSASSSSEPIGITDTVPFIPSSPPPSLPPTTVIVTPPPLSPTISSNSNNSKEDMSHDIEEEIFNENNESNEIHINHQSDQQEEHNEFIQSLLLSLQQKQNDTTTTTEEEKAPSISTLSSSSSSQSSTSPVAAVSSCPVPLSSPPKLLSQPLTTRSLSLQEAFQLKKQSFIENSQNRIKQLEENKTKGQQQVEHDDKPIKLVTFSSPAILGDNRDTSSCIKYTPPSIHRGHHSEQLLITKRTKIPAKEMYSRNARMYSRLPEVQERMRASQRDKEYAENREKAKKYNQMLRNRVGEKKK